MFLPTNFPVVMGTVPVPLRIFLATVTKEDLRSALTDAGLTVSASTDKADLSGRITRILFPSRGLRLSRRLLLVCFPLAPLSWAAQARALPFSPPLSITQPSKLPFLPTLLPTPPLPLLWPPTRPWRCLLDRWKIFLTTKISEQRNYVDQRFASELLPIISSSLLSEPSSPGLISSLAPSSSASPHFLTVRLAPPLVVLPHSRRWMLGPNGLISLPPSLIRRWMAHSRSGIYGSWTLPIASRSNGEGCRHRPHLERSVRVAAKHLCLYGAVSFPG
ncbi:hypothetical protein AYX14_01941 [Cryptococcus neoformans]|nr:hypothetical protein AYX14_01941 [Cryptococcus neoformans var. grubii]